MLKKPAAPKPATKKAPAKKATAAKPAAKKATTNKKTAAKPKANTAKPRKASTAVCSFSPPSLSRSRVLTVNAGPGRR
jgi:histone H1/5